MKWKLDSARLAAFVRLKQGKRSLRAAALEADVSFMTLNRVMHSEGCELSVLLRLSEWVNEDPRSFFRPIIENDN